MHSLKEAPCKSYTRSLVRSESIPTRFPTQVITDRTVAVARISFGYKKRAGAKEFPENSAGGQGSVVGAVFHTFLPL